MRKRDFSYNDLGLVTSEVWVDGFGNAVKTIVHGYDDAGRETSRSYWAEKRGRKPFFIERLGLGKGLRPLFSPRIA